MTNVRVLLIFMLASLTACSTEPCGAPRQFGIVVEIRDANTGAPAAQGAAAVATNGNFSESLGQLDELRLAGLNDRPGTYNLTVNRPGYHTIQRFDIEVSDECLAEPVVIAVELQPHGS